MTRVFSDRLKDFPAQEREDKSASHDLAQDAYDVIPVSPEVIQPGTGSSRSFYATFDVLTLAVGALARFNIMHKDEWTIGGSFHVRLFVAPAGALGLADLILRHRGWKNLSGLPTPTQALNQSFDFTTYTVNDLVALDYWDIHTSDGDELVHGFQIENTGISVNLAGAVVSHKANRV